MHAMQMCVVTHARARGPACSDADYLQAVAARLAASPLPALAKSQMVPCEC